MKTTVVILFPFLKEKPCYSWGGRELKVEEVNYKSQYTYESDNLLNWSWTVLPLSLKKKTMVK